MIKFNSIGSDPEFFIVSKSKKMLPSFAFIEGTKDEPEDMGNGFSLLKDNLLIEGNIPACETKEEFIDAMKFLKDMINAVASTKNAHIHCSDLETFTKRYLNTPDGLSFGCSSYINAWSKKEVRTPILANLDSRSAGFHIHIGYDILESGYSKEQINTAIARAFDFFVTLPSDQIYFCDLRRKYYGAYGSYRNKPYGLEVRALGGYFAQDKYLGWVYDQTVKTIEYTSKNMDKLLNLKMDKPTEDSYKELNINLSEQIPKI